MNNNIVHKKNNVNKDDDVGIELSDGKIKAKIV